MEVKEFYSLMTTVVMMMATASMAAAQPDAISDLTKISNQVQNCDNAIVGSDVTLMIWPTDHPITFYSHWSKLKRRPIGTRCILWVMVGFDHKEGNKFSDVAREVGLTSPKDFYLFVMGSRMEGEAILSTVGRALVNVVAMSASENNSSLVFYTVRGFGEDWKEIVILDMWKPVKGKQTFYSKGVLNS